MPPWHYVIRKHDDHWHVIDENADRPALDDRPNAPWQYGKRKDAAAVVKLLNRGWPTYELRLMDMDEIHASARHLSGSGQSNH